MHQKREREKERTNKCVTVRFFAVLFFELMKCKVLFCKSFVLTRSVFE